MPKNRVFIVQVSLPKDKLDHSLLIDSLLDMLRYAGKIQRAPNFPNVFTYETDHDPSQEIERWKSYQIEAEWLEVK